MIFRVVFAVLALLGAWAALRRNPAYSGSERTRTLVVTLASVGAFIAVILLAVSLTVSRPPIVMGVTLGVIVLLGAPALILFLTAVSTPKGAKFTSEIPPGVEVVHTHRQQTYLIAKILLPFIAVCALLIPLFSGERRLIPAMICGMGLWIAVLVLPVSYYTARQRDLALTALMASPWLHWQYTQQQWQQWCDALYGRASSESADPEPPSRRYVAIGAIALLVALPVSIRWPASGLTKFLIFIGIVGVFAILVMWPKPDPERVADRLRMRLLRCNPEVYFGHDGIFANGLFTAWLSTNVYLISATTEEDTPPRLHFAFERIRAGYASGGAQPMELFLPLPAGADRDLASLQQYLSARCPQATVRLA